MSTMLSPADYLSAYDALRGRFADIVAEHPASIAVPGCPGWTLRELTDHLGGVHGWAVGLIAGGRPDGSRPEAPADDAALSGWYSEQSTRLADALRAADPAAEAWTFGADRTVGFWLRRQAHETAMHLIDAEQAVGERTPYFAMLAPDAVSEVFDVMTPRVLGRGGATAPVTARIRLQATDSDDSWLLRPADSPGTVDYEHQPGSQDADAVIEATASDLVLRLWGREPVNEWSVSGDAAAVSTFLAGPLTP